MGPIQFYWTIVSTYRGYRCL